MITWSQNLKHLSKKEYDLLRYMCHLSKNVYNCALYNVRKHLETHGVFLKYEGNYAFMKCNENYRMLGASVAQQTMRSVDAAVKSYFALLKWKKENISSSLRVQFPHYLPKDALYPIVFVQSQIKDGKFRVPMSAGLKEYSEVRLKISLPPYLDDKKIRQIHIVPVNAGRYFEVRYIFDDPNVDTFSKVNLDASKALAIDLGINNFATCVTSEGRSFIIDGRKIKSINQWYNKELARLSSIKDRQGIKGYTKRQCCLVRKRNHRVQDFIYKSCKYIVDYCIYHKIGHIVIGYSAEFQQSPQIVGRIKQQFVQLPFGKFNHRLNCLCQRFGIDLVLQEESYTSMSSFFDNDPLPVFGAPDAGKIIFSGRRIHRGLYQTSCGRLINADVNGALNILKKSNVVDLSVLYSRGDVYTPMRIRSL